MSGQKRRKLKYSALAAAFIIFLFNICAFAKAEIPEHTDKFFVNDFAGVIDEETERYIYEKGQAYNNGGGPQVVVLTMNSIDGYSVEDFSIETARKWGIGDKDADNGVLILLVMDSRDIRVEVGYGLEGVLNDGKCGRYIRKAAPLLSDGDYSGGIKQLYDDIIGELEAPTPDEEEEEDSALTMIISVIIVMAVFGVWGLIAMNIGGRGGRGGGFGGFGGYRGYGGFGGGFRGHGGGFGGGGASGKF